MVSDIIKEMDREFLQAREIEVNRLPVSHQYEFDQELITNLATALSIYTQYMVAKERQQEARGLGRDSREKIGNTAEKIRDLAKEIESLLHDPSIYPALIEQFQGQFHEEQELDIEIEHPIPSESPFMLLSSYGATHPARADDEYPSAEAAFPADAGVLGPPRDVPPSAPWSRLVASRTIDRMRKLAEALQSVSEMQTESTPREDLVNVPQRWFVYMVFKALREFVDWRGGEKQVIKSRDRAQVVIDVFGVLGDAKFLRTRAKSAGQSPPLRIALQGVEFSGSRLAQIFSDAKPGKPS